MSDYYRWDFYCGGEDLWTQRVLTVSSLNIYITSSDIFIAWYLLKENQLTQLHVFQRASLGHIPSLHFFNDPITVVFNCCIRAIWIRNWIFWHQQDHWGVFSGNQSCLMGWAGGWSWQRDKEGDWKQPNFWEELLLLKLGQDIGCVHPVLTPQPPSVLRNENSSWKEIFMQKSCSHSPKWAHSDGTGEKKNKPWAHTTHLDHLMEVQGFRGLYTKIGFSLHVDTSCTNRQILG